MIPTSARQHTRSAGRSSGRVASRRAPRPSAARCAGPSSGPAFARPVARGRPRPGKTARPRPPRLNCAPRREEARQVTIRAGVAKLADLGEQLADFGRSFRPPARQQCAEIRRRACFRRHRTGLRQIDATYPAIDAPGTDAQLPRDLRDGVAGFVEVLICSNMACRAASRSRRSRRSCITTSKQPSDRSITGCSRVSGSSSTGSGDSRIGASKRRSCRSTVSRKSFNRWKRSATCRA